MSAVMLRLLAMLLAAGLAGCEFDEADDVPDDAAAETVSVVQEAAEPIGAAVAAVAHDIEDAVGEVAELLPTPPPAPPAAALPIAPEAIDLLVQHEIGSEALYTRRYQGIACPGGHSGPTIGIGWDLGTQTRATILEEWAEHPEVQRLAEAAGHTGPARCKAMQRKLGDIRVSYAQARRVFERYSLVKYYRIAHRSFGAEFEHAHPKVKGALTDTVYMRGGSMNGSRRTELRHIRDHCLAPDNACTADQVQRQIRLWVGTDIERNMRRRTTENAMLIRSASA